MRNSAFDLTRYRGVLREARALLKLADVHTLLAAPSANPKVAKNAKLGVLTAPLHLAPADLSGYNVCPMASLGCKAACLHTAGNPVYMAQKLRSRLAKTRAYFEHREAFMALLVAEIAAVVRKADREGMAPGIRLNATSDIPWERVPVVVHGRRYPNVMAVFPEVEFYDYTKRANRKNLPANYSLTFSLAEDNDADALAALRNGMNVAVVFDVKRGRDLPASFDLLGCDVRVIDGDEHDFRPADDAGVIVGLRAKGDAIGDTSGFVREAFPAAVAVAA